MNVKQQELFHQLDHVAVPFASVVGVIKAFAPEENLALVISHDGKTSDWYHLDELQAINMHAHTPKETKDSTVDYVSRVLSIGGVSL